MRYVVVAVKMQKLPQEEAENAEKLQSCEVAASPDAPAMTEDQNIFVFLDFKVGKVKGKYPSLLALLLMDFSPR